MDGNKLQRALRDAVELAEGVPEVYRPAAFRVAAEVLLQEEMVTTGRQAGPRASAYAAAGANQAVNEVLAVLRNRSHTDKFKVILFHALSNEGVEELSLDQVLAAYATGRIARPTNPSDIMGKCMRSGHVSEGGRRDGHRTWRLTGSGQRYVEELLREATSADE